MRRALIILCGFLIISGGVYFVMRPAYTPPKTEVEQIVDVAGLPRILVIGDSISLGWTPYVRKALVDKANVHHVPQNSKSTAFALPHLDYWLGGTPWSVIIINFGLHDLARTQTWRGWNGPIQVPVENYKQNLEKIILRLKQTDARLIWATTTRVPSGTLARSEGAEEPYNTAASEIMQRHGIEVVDLYGVAAEQLPQDVHFTENGYEVLAAAILNVLR